MAKVENWKEWIEIRKNFLLVWQEAHGEMRCYYCERGNLDIIGIAGGKNKNVVTVDHKIERRNGGTDDYDNLVPACQSCNSLRDKREMTAEDFLLFRRSQTHSGRRYQFDHNMWRKEWPWWKNKLEKYLKKARKKNHSILTSWIQRLNKRPQEEV